MKVSKNSVSSSYRSGSAAAGAAYGKAQKVEAPSSVNDSLEVSESAGLFQKAVDAIQNVPDIRMEAVSGIQQEFKDGSYHRDEVEVAEKVIQDGIDSPI